MDAQRERERRADLARRQPEPRLIWWARDQLAGCIKRGHHAIEHITVSGFGCEPWSYLRCTDCRGVRYDPCPHLWLDDSTVERESRLCIWCGAD